MSRDDLLKVLQDSRPALAQFGVARLSVFGSFARDEALEALKPQLRDRILGEAMIAASLGSETS